MLAPHINLNGTDAESLYDEYLKAANAIGDAANAVYDITVHGRDYDQMTPGTTQIAEREKREIIRKLDDLVTELHEVITVIESQVDENWNIKQA